MNAYNHFYMDNVLTVYMHMLKKYIILHSFQNVFYYNNSFFLSDKCLIRWKKLTLANMISTYTHTHTYIYIYVCVCVNNNNNEIY